MKLTKTILAVAAILAAATTASLAAPAVWTNSGTGNINWDDTAWWTLNSGDPLPPLNGYPNGIDETAIFSTGATLTQNISLGITLGHIKFNVTGAALYGDPITLATSSGKPTITLGSSTNPSTCSIYTPFAGNQGLTFVGQPTGQANLTLNANSTFTGPINITNTGSARIEITVNHNNALGVASATPADNFIYMGVAGLGVNGVPNRLFLGDGISISGRTLVFAATGSYLATTRAGINAASTAVWNGDIFLDRGNVNSNFPSSTSVYLVMNKGGAGLCPSILTINGNITAATAATSSVGIIDNREIVYATDSTGLSVVKLMGDNNTPTTNAIGILSTLGTPDLRATGSLAFALGSDMAFGLGSIAINNNLRYVSFFSSDATDRLIRNNISWNTQYHDTRINIPPTIAFGAVANGSVAAAIGSAPMVWDTSEGFVGTGNITLSGWLGTINSNGADSGRIINLQTGALGSSNSTFVLNLTGDLMMHSGVTALNKIGGGTLIIARTTNTYAGIINIREGTILITGRHSGALDVIKGTLGGTGNIVGAVKVYGDTGSGGGNLVFGTNVLTAITPLNIAATGSLDLATDWSLTLNPSSSWVLDEWVRVINCAVITDDLFNFSLTDNTNLADVGNWNIEVRTGTTTEQGLWVQPASIPEPTTWALLGASLLVVTLLRRKKVS